MEIIPVDLETMAGGEIILCLRATGDALTRVTGNIFITPAESI